MTTRTMMDDNDKDDGEDKMTMLITAVLMWRVVVVTMMTVMARIRAMITRLTNSMRTIRTSIATRQMMAIPRSC